MNKNNENQKITSSEGYYGVDTYNKNGYIGTAIESNEKNIYNKISTDEGYIKNSLNPNTPTSPRPKVAGSKQK